MVASMAGFSQAKRTASSSSGQPADDASSMAPARPLTQLNAGLQAGEGVEGLRMLQAQLAPVAQQMPNGTGLPDTLKQGVEALSGLSLNDVKVHRNSAEPARMQAHAFARGSDIHLAPGQEQHLPHEAWHVVQQKQGRVAATVQAVGQNLNTDPALEREADVMGARAAAAYGQIRSSDIESAPRVGVSAGNSVVQRTLIFSNEDNDEGGPFFRAVNQQNEIIRPQWVGPWATHLVGHGEARNHVIAYNHMAEALTNILNMIFQQRANGGNVENEITALISMTDSLFPGRNLEDYMHQNSFQLMVNNRNHIIQTIIENAQMENLNGEQTQQISDQATALESDIMSAPENVRIGDAQKNQSIGDNIDSDMHLTTLPNYAIGQNQNFLRGNVIPAGWLQNNGENWGALRNGGNIAVGSAFYLMNEVHNNIVDSFTQSTANYLSRNVSIARNDEPNSIIYNNFPHSAPVNSTQTTHDDGLEGGAHPVLLFDPTGQNLPLRFN